MNLNPEWSVVYKKAINEDGSLLFPERLSQKFLDSARRTMGSYLFANQYNNEVIPDDERKFQPEWLRYYTELPKNVINFGFVDPAIGQKKHNDFTAITVVSVDELGRWWLRVANRYKINPTKIVEKMFEVTKLYDLRAIGLETVAYQKALVWMAIPEMNKRKVTLPLKEIPRRTLQKDTRILRLVPRFEWNRIQIPKGLTDFENEYSTFPRGSHDDILDSLASIEEIFYIPKFKEIKIEKPHNPAHPDYERWYIQSLKDRKPHIHPDYKDDDDERNII